MALTKQKLTPMQALEKLKHYCSYQERSHAEVVQQLYAYSVYKGDHDAIIASLIEKNYLNQERFAIALVGGKHRAKSWGRIKIMNALKAKGVTSTYILKEAFKQIDEVAYLKKLQNFADKKWATLKGEQYLIKKKKLYTHLLQKGYESKLVLKEIERLEGSKK